MLLNVILFFIVVLKEKYNCILLLLLKHLIYYDDFVAENEYTIPLTEEEYTEILSGHSNFGNTSTNIKQKSIKTSCKKHSCYFCGALLTNLRKHWRRKHSTELLFKEALMESCK